MKSPNLLFFILFLSVTHSYTQNVEKIATKDGIHYITTNIDYPIPGVNIIQKGTKNIVQSNFAGDFKIKIPIEDFEDKVVLVFNYIGMDSKEVEVFKTKNNLKIEMILSDALMGEVIIVKTKKKNIFTRIGNLFK